MGFSMTGNYDPATGWATTKITDRFRWRTRMVLAWRMLRYGALHVEVAWKGNEESIAIDYLRVEIGPD